MQFSTSDRYLIHPIPGTDISVPIQYDIGNARLFVLIFEIGSFVTP